MPVPSPNRHTLTGLPLRPVRPYRDERNGGSQGGSQDTDHWGSLGVKSLSLRMQEELFNGASPAHELEEVSWSDEN